MKEIHTKLNTPLSSGKVLNMRYTILGVVKTLKGILWTFPLWTSV